MKKNWWLKCSLICCMAVPIQAMADGDSESSAPVIHAGGMAIYPGFSVLETQNDNLFRSDLNRKASLITEISPAVLVQAKKGADKYSFNYNADLGRYGQSTPDNFNDQNFSAEADWAISSRASFSLSPQYKIGHDARGSAYYGFTPVPSVWHNTVVDGKFSYGRDEAKGKVVLEASSTNIRYQNNRLTTSGFDKDLDNLIGTFYYHATPKISTFVQLSDLRIKYIDDLFGLAGREERVMVGAVWKATAKTSGSFQVGQLRKLFNNTQFQTFNGTSWQGNIRWAPREYARVDWQSSRVPYEATGIGSFVLTTDNELNLGYDMSARTTLHVIAGRLNENFEQVGRTDVTPTYGFEADYKLRQWLIVNAGYSNYIKTSTGYVGPSPEYHANMITLGIHTEL